MNTRLLAVLLVSSLILASAATVALAQDDRRASVQYVDCSQVQNAVGGQYGNAIADGRDSSAEVAQELNISQDQLNACLGNVDENGDGDRDDKNDGENKNAKDDDDKANVMADTIPEGTLPNTGGPSLLALSAGLALVACGAALIGGASLTRFRR